MEASVMSDLARHFDDLMIERLGMTRLRWYGEMLQPEEPETIVIEAEWATIDLPEELAYLAGTCL